MVPAFRFDHYAPGVAIANIKDHLYSINPSIIIPHQIKCDEIRQIALSYLNANSRAQSRTPPPKSSQSSLANQTRTPSLKSCQRVSFSQPLAVELSPIHAQSDCPQKQSDSCFSQALTCLPQSSSPDLPLPPKKQKTKAPKQPYTQSSPALTSSHKCTHSRCVIEISDTTTDEDTPSPPYHINFHQPALLQKMLQALPMFLQIAAFLLILAAICPQMSQFKRSLINECFASGNPFSDKQRFHQPPSRTPSQMQHKPRSLNTFQPPWCTPQTSASKRKLLNSWVKTSSCNSPPDNNNGPKNSLPVLPLSKINKRSPLGTLVKRKDIPSHPTNNPNPANSTHQSTNHFTIAEDEPLPIPNTFQKPSLVAQSSNPYRQPQKPYHYPYVNKSLKHSIVIPYPLPSPINMEISSNSINPLFNHQSIYEVPSLTITVPDNDFPLPSLSTQQVSTQALTLKPSIYSPYATPHLSPPLPKTQNTFSELLQPPLLLNCENGISAGALPPIPPRPKFSCKPPNCSSTPIPAIPTTKPKELINSLSQFQPKIDSSLGKHWACYEPQASYPRPTNQATNLFQPVITPSTTITPTPSPWLLIISTPPNMTQVTP
ncbi:hypothetical protein O181_000951 [Austropuccinia psidii MF-1]|uniref:Uncharacterized protein n=1 Tax=Austropuccinia psidii MF-1 TaxID=1389203 RepID=A0A9Q3B9F6_9BASI|nr:hypothetical protein [Austropuccinia psidii MF-1]